jgi:amidohydrolase
LNIQQGVLTETKDLVRQQIASAEPELVRLSRAIHGHPELRFAEHLASQWTCEVLEKNGFAVRRGIGGLETAFDATIGHGDLVVAICAEYDALPEVGHACGHNLICASSVGAAIGLAVAADELGITVKLIGTPGEEGGGGKVILLDAGVFDGVHAAIMAHPAPGDGDLIDMAPVFLASIHLEIEYSGKAAHAAGRPHEGINALDAVTIAQTAIGLLRQQLTNDDLIHGIVRHGGDAPNIIPERTVQEYLVRSLSIEQAEAVARRLRCCFEAGALATGCSVDIRQIAPSYSHLESDRDLTRFYAGNAQALGRSVFEMPTGRRLGSGSTDMANVSLVVPSIHPAFGVPGATVAPHHRDFAAACNTPASEAALIHAATALAWTVVDAARTQDVRARLLRGERLTRT